MAKSTVEELLQAAKSSPNNDSSINIAKRKFLSEEDARDFFQQTRARMLDIREWKPKSSVTTYDLFDEAGLEINDAPIGTGLFIRIGLYGGGKYDWVRVVAIIDEADEMIVKVKPTFDPTAEDRDPASISHFFAPEAENNFCLQREGEKVAFYVIGLREKQNTRFADGLIEAARNAAIANVGYYSGLQKGVWKEFCLNFLRTDEETAD